jgi:hypothetical protein
MNMSETNDETRDYHYKGKTNNTGWPGCGSRIPPLPKIVTYRTCILHDGIRGNHDALSDEFLNDYIPENLDKFVTWKDVLACGMIPEQRNNLHIREDIKFQNIPIELPLLLLPEAPSPAPVPSVIHAELASSVRNDEITEMKDRISELERKLEILENLVKPEEPRDRGR